MFVFSDGYESIRVSLISSLTQDNVSVSSVDQIARTQRQIPAADLGQLFKI